jgi:oxygen-independent coproporphyrinogen-3 oxidase
LGKILPPADYVELLKKEIRLRAPTAPAHSLETVYFGGGTPSLIEPSLILSLIEELANAGFRTNPDSEITIEIDPKTVGLPRLETYRRMGFNRFSVGAQTFNERLLKIAGRQHNSSDTVELLTLLSRENVNFSFDLLFGLPSQTISELREDVHKALEFNPPHLSPYLLTVPEGHPLSRGRAPDDEQAEMFGFIDGALSKAGILRYEISNFARPGYESRHNLLYWTDRPYLGFGAGAHSYYPGLGPWGTRFWNAPSVQLYQRAVLGAEGKMSDSGSEGLEIHQSLSDFCHTSLRLARGLSKNALRLKFGNSAYAIVDTVAKEAIDSQLIQDHGTAWSLSDKGRLLANQAFEKFTFLDSNW